MILSVLCADGIEDLVSLLVFGSYIFGLYFIDVCLHAPVTKSWHPPNPGVPYTKNPAEVRDFLFVYPCVYTSR